MRRHRALREPQCQSLCAFCAHRFVDVRRSAHVRRQFLHSSRPASKPGAQATALREEHDDESSNTTSAPVASEWGRPTFGNGSQSAPVSGFGRPTFGAAAASTNTSIELTPEEQRLRDQLQRKAQTEQRRVVNIPSGPGPEATRAGRPIPREYGERNSAPQSQNQSSKPLMIRFGSSKFGSPPITRNPNNVRQDNYDQSSNWGHLRTKSQRPAQETNPQANSFERGRTQREEQSKFRRFVSLGDRTIVDGEPKKPQTPTNSLREWGSEGALRSRNPANSRFDWSGGNINNRSSESNSVNTRDSKHNEFFRSGEQQREPTRPSSMESGWRPAILQEAPIPHKNVEEPTSRVRGRIAASLNSQDMAMPKDKGKAKARRRDQFAAEYEEDNFAAEAERRAELKRQRKREKAAKKAAAPTPILLPEYISVSNLASALRVRTDEFIEKMEELGFEELSGDHILNAENAGLVAQEYNYEAIIDRGMSEDLTARPAAEDPSNLPQRPPIVTIMGHVDHGKTTLLDWLRKSSVAATEHGGITQHIGAFSVPMPGGKLITFLDTPGHAAFLSMRQRGANVTDIVILVVAADDSVKPQTIEAINHAKAAKVPIIVAVNKIDKEGANVERVKQDLARHSVDVEDFGGDTQVVCVSGKTGQGMEELEEAAVTLSEILDMRAEKDGQAEGWVLEASIKPVGKVATVLVRRGTMRPGDFIVAGKTWARIRCLRNEAGVEVSEASPGTPVEVDGWREQPLAGDEVLQAVDENKAKRVVEYRLEKDERDKMAADMEAINEARKAEQEKREREKREAAIAAGEEVASEETIPEVIDDTKQIYFIVKGDVSGSVEAVVDSISALGNKEVQPHVLRSGVGQLTEFDVQHAADAKGHLINFNTTVDPNIAALAAKAKVTILDHNIIYRLVDDVREKLSEQLAPLVTQRVTGEADIAQVFEITVKGRQQKAVAGCKVRNGVVHRASKVRVLRGGEKVFDGTFSSLKNLKKDVLEVKKGSECGLGFETWTDFMVGDQIQCYEEVSEKRYL